MTADSQINVSPNAISPEELERIRQARREAGLVQLLPTWGLAAFYASTCAIAGVWLFATQSFLCCGVIAAQGLAYPGRPIRAHSQFLVSQFL